METVLEPGTIIKPPPINNNDVEILLNKYFDIKTSSISQLKSYDDLNFLIKTGTENCTEKFIFKVMNSLDSKNLELVLAQNDIMTYLSKKGFYVPKPIMNNTGSTIIKENLKHSERSNDNDCYYVLRLLSFIEGKILVDVTYTPNLLNQIGNYLAKIDLSLQNFKNEAVRKRKFIWMLECVPELTKFVYAMKNEEKQNLINIVVDEWISVVQSNINGLEKGIIHGDFNEQNVIVREDENDASFYNIHGLIDFGDVNYSPYVFELAMAIAYMMLDAKHISLIDVGGYVLSGYTKIRNIPQLEWDVLKECVAARLSQSLVLGAYSNLQDPDNKYVLTTSETAWKCLNELWQCPKIELVKRWKEIASTFQS